MRCEYGGFGWGGELGGGAAAEDVILILCEQLNEMKMELHKAKCREGNLERELKTLAVSYYSEE